MPALCCALLFLLPALLARADPDPDPDPGTGAGQGSRSDIDIYSFLIESRVASRYARTVITSRVANRADRSQEIAFQVELPKTAFISNFSMTVQGRTYVGVVKEKEAARQQYSEAVSRGESAGLVGTVGRTLEEFKTSVNVAPLSKVTFELTYEELLKRRLGKYELMIKARPKQVVSNFKIDVRIYEPQGIRSVEAQGSLTSGAQPDLLQISESEGTVAHVEFAPTVEQQQCADCAGSGLDGDLVIKYDVNRELPQGVLQVQNGYFVHYFSPANIERIPKNVVFVIDRSGSMSGRKIVQTREALLKILADVHEDDHFGLITFDSEVTPWKDSLVRASGGMLEEARGFVRQITDRGATDINAALEKGVAMLNKAKEEKTVPEGSTSIIILLTDGDPTTGVTNLGAIQANVKEAIQKRYTLYCLGFGFDVNLKFLEKMALENGGVARRIYEDSDSDLQLQGFYEEVATPLLVNVEMLYAHGDAANVTQSTFDKFYNGSEIVVAGRISDNSLEVLTAEVKAQSKDSIVTYQAQIPVAGEGVGKDFPKAEYIYGEYIERLWAYLTVQQLLEQEVLASDSDKPEIRQCAQNLSLQYNFVTPLTSMVVTRPEEGQSSVPQVAEKPSEEQAQNRRHGTRRYHTQNHPIVHHLSGQAVIPGRTTVDRTKQRSPSKSISRPGFRFRGGSERIGLSADTSLGFDYRHMGLEYDDVTDFVHVAIPTRRPGLDRTTPRIIIPAPGNHLPICFEIPVSGGQIVKLLEDPSAGIVVRGEVMSRRVRAFQKLGIWYNEEFHIVATPSSVSLTNNHTLTARWWSWPAANYTSGSVSLAVVDTVLEVTLGSTVLEVLRHRVRHKDFLWLKIKDHAFGSQASGLTGEFGASVSYTETTTSPTTASINIKGVSLNAQRISTADYGSRVKASEECWLLEGGGRGLLQPMSQYLVSEL
nr:PREDICTED: inter-alpha-trypsin inhibitor heavy chain H4-like isoform X3 [Lepisosteus oculatus]